MKPAPILFAIVLSTQSLAPALAAEPYAGYGYEPTQGDHIGEKEYSPYLAIGYPKRVFWGDTHLHTSYSTDAGMIGNRLGPMRLTGSRAARPSCPAPACVPGYSVRWTTYDAAFYGADLPEGVPPTQQERAYTSPIWYTP
ncbi:MAG: DUF3604 domain-containing protein [Lysobacterales bacterium]